MAKGILKSFVPKMNGNVQDSYTGQHGTLYKFIVTLEENGVQTTGEANSKSQSPSWKLNNEYNYEVVVNGNYTNIKNMKDANATPFGAGKKTDPSFVVQKAFECACECTIKFLSVNKESYNEAVEGQILNVFFSELVKVKDEKQRWMRISAMRIIVEKYVIFHTQLKIEGKPSAWILSNIDHLAGVMSENVKFVVENDGRN